ncbi:hypothetical protein [Bosea sp. AK1]|uniref:hypothetical protein n=1 Tax=Bosea sp. AK1 TaxID=2587160 RepID=UPI0020BF39D7|nr:hypothetical protein [Bosea sp. AK1]
MVELMAGPLIGDKTSASLLEFDQCKGAAPCHGKLIFAFDPTVFLRDEAAHYLAGAELIFNAIVGQGARLPSQRRYEARKRNEEVGACIPRSLHDDLHALLQLSYLQ